MTPDPSTLAPLISFFAAVITACLVPRVLDNRIRFWKTVRSKLPLFHDEAKQNGFYTAVQLEKDSYAGTVGTTPDQTFDILQRFGYSYQWLASHKTDPYGRSEVGSFAWRDYPPGQDSTNPLRRLYAIIVPRRQVHVMLFENADGTTDLYAHEEYSAYNPLVATLHFYGVHLSPQDGIETVRSHIRQADIPLDIRDDRRQSRNNG